MRQGTTRPGSQSRRYLGRPDAWSLRPLLSPAVWVMAFVGVLKVFSFGGKELRHPQALY